MCDHFLRIYHFYFVCYKTAQASKHKLQAEELLFNEGTFLASTPKRITRGTLSRVRRLRRCSIFRWIRTSHATIASTNSILEHTPWMFTLFSHVNIFTSIFPCLYLYFYFPMFIYFTDGTLYLIKVSSPRDHFIVRKKSFEN